ncbi:MAG: lipopolysaccharide kinase InaA family protein [Methyloprofundus sp.]|nr:lipopolysaccharide kinase InaA family protein [Methyloprofundus sp.]MDT8425789.1 lipopolysaccharide kinase InaA family protein [Methyloprofundus sp.]
MKIVVASPYKSADIQYLLNAIHNTGHVEYQGRNTVKSIKVADKIWNVKIFKIPHLLNKFVYRYFRKSKAQRSFEYAHKLLEKGFYTPNPIAFAEQRSALFLSDSFYISEHLDCQLTFRTLIHEPQYPDRTRILKEFTAFTYNLQESGIHFVDHSPGNTLIVKQKNDSYKFYLVDLNRMSFKPLSYQTRIENFTRLALTEDMLEIIALEYATLCQKEYQDVYNDMLNASHKFQNKRAKLSALKKKFKP